MPPDHAILFADIEGSVQLFRRLGDAKAFALVETSHATMLGAITRHSGTLVKTIGDGVMAVFSDAGAACAAAMQIQQAISLAGRKPGAIPVRLRMGVHLGQTIETGGDHYGDAVNIASRLSAVASGGEIIVSASMAEALPAHQRLMLRRLGSIALKGLANPLPVLELLWSHDGAVTLLPHDIAKQTVVPGNVRLEASNGSSRWSLVEAGARLAVGRNATSDFLVADPRASRDHATIQRSGEQWVLADHSTNGTFVVFAGESAIALRRQELVLHGLGDIGFGFDPAIEPAESLRFTLFSTG